MRVLILLVLGLAMVIAAPSNPLKIVGGSVTSIELYPFATALLYSRNGVSYFFQACGGTIINNRSILSAAHCFIGDSAIQWRARVGSTEANHGGILKNIDRLIIHPAYNGAISDNDVAVLRISGTFSFNDRVQAASIAGANYQLADNSTVWAIGWGTLSSGGPASELLRHVQIWTVNQNTCRERYADIRRNVTDNMLCSGWLDVGGRDQCQGDSGGPLIHNRVIVGVCSWGEQCALPRYPGVNSRVSRFTSWILDNA